MPYKKSKRQDPIAYMDLKTYFANKAIHDRATFVYKPSGVSFYVLDGFVTSADDFMRAYPLSMYKPNPKGENPDKRYDYLKP